MNRPRWKIIGRGLVGWHAQSDNCSSSGGNIDPYVHKPSGEHCPGYAQEAEEGCPVYDASKANEADFITLTVRGPIVNTALEDQGPAAYAYAGGLTYVPVAEYIRRVRHLKGVRIGKVHNGQVVWESPEPSTYVEPKQIGLYEVQS